MTFSRTLAFVGCVACVSAAPKATVDEVAVISPLKIRMSNPTSFCDDTRQRIAIEDLVVAHLGAASSRFLMEECFVDSIEEDLGRRLSGKVLLQLTLSSLGAFAAPNFGTAVLNTLAEAIHDVIPTATVKSIETPTHKVDMPAVLAVPTVPPRTASLAPSPRTTPATSSTFGWVPLSSPSQAATGDEPQAPPGLSQVLPSASSGAPATPQATTSTPGSTSSDHGESMVNDTERAADLARESLTMHMLNEVTPAVVIHRRAPATVGCTLFLMVSAVAFLVRRVVARVTNEASSGHFLEVLKEEDCVEWSDGFRVVFDDDHDCVE